MWGCLGIIIAGIVFILIVSFLSDVLGMETSVAVFLTIIGGIGLYHTPSIIESHRREREEAEKVSREARQKNATNLLERADTVIVNCKDNEEKAKRLFPKPEIKTIDLQKETWHLFDEISLEIQMLENTLKELKVKGSK